VLKRVSIGFFAAVFSGVIPKTMAAQSCVGLPSLASHPMNVGAGASFADNATALGGRFGFGSSTAFAGVSASLQDYDEVDENSASLGVDGGLVFPVGVSRSASVCPIASIGYQFGHSIDTGFGKLELGTLSLGAGAAFGGAVYSTEGLQLLPFASAELAYARMKADYEGETESDSETFGVLNLGMAFLFNSRFGVRPSVAIPVGLEGADPTFGLSFVVGFGRR